MENLDGNIKEGKNKANELDLKSEISCLTMDAIISKREASTQLFSLSRMNASILWQNSHFKWLKEGGANTKYFRRCMVNRRKTNEITCIETQNEKLAEVQEVKHEILEHFLEIFRNR